MELNGQPNVENEQKYFADNNIRPDNQNMCISARSVAQTYGMVCAKAVPKENSDGRQPSDLLQL